MNVYSLQELDFQKYCKSSIISIDSKRSLEKGGDKNSIYVIVNEIYNIYLFKLNLNTLELTLIIMNEE